MREAIRAVLGAREDERLLHLAALEQREEQRGLELLRDRVDRLRDPHRRRGLARQIDAGGIAEHLAAERRDRRGNRGAEEERLAARGNVAQHAADLRQEAHVEHAIRFVEHEELEPGELRVGEPEVIEQPAGRRDQDVDAAADGVLLRPHADTAEDRRGGDGRVHGEIVQILEDLGRQLARGREHERPRRAARLLDQLVQDGQQEGGGLAASGGGAGEHVPAGERREGWRRPGSASGGRIRAL